MPKDPRTYITVHDGLPDHPKIEVLSDAAFRLLITSWCYCSRHLTDGQIKTAVWERRSTPEARAELIDAGLAIASGCYVEMHDYTEHQRTAAEVEDLKSKRADAGRRGGLAKASNAVASAKARGKQTSSKSVAESDTEDKNSLSTLREDVERLCNLLADKIAENGSRRPTVSDAWRNQCRLLLDKDGRTEAQVRRCIEWCQADSFWSGNVLSMPKLREKYDQLRLKAVADQAEKDAKRHVQPVPAYVETPAPAPESLPWAAVASA